MIFKLINIFSLLKNLKPAISCVTIFILFSFSLLFHTALAGSQIVKNYDPQTNTYYPGCGSSNKIESFEGTHMTPALFNWQMAQTPTIQLIRSIDFIDTLNGYITYYEGVMKTVNGGLNWQEVYFDQGDDINGINFVNRDTGWICGSMSRIRKTTNGGENWITQDYPPFAGPYYYSVRFIDYNTGYITGSANALRGYIIKTTNS